MYFIETKNNRVGIYMIDTLWSSGKFYYKEESITDTRLYAKNIVTSSDAIDRTLWWDDDEFDDDFLV